MTAERRRRIWKLPDPMAPTSAEPAKEVALLRDLLHTLLRADDPTEAFQFALDRACPAVGAALGSVFVVDGTGEMMRLAAAHAWPERWRPWLSEMRVRVGFGPSGEAASERRVIEVADVFADPSLEDWQEVAKELGFCAIVALPLIAGSRLEGTLTFYFAEPGTPRAPTRALLGAIADLMAAVAEKGTLRERLRRAEALLDERTPHEPDQSGEGAGASA